MLSAHKKLVVLNYMSLLYYLLLKIKNIFHFRSELRVESKQIVLEKVILLDGNPYHACMSRVTSFHGLSI